MLIRHPDLFPMFPLLLPIPQLQPRLDIPLKMPLEPLLQLRLDRPCCIENDDPIGLDERSDV